jgi:bacteriorhodopsin
MGVREEYRTNKVFRYGIWAVGAIAALMILSQIYTYFAT